MKFHTHVFNAPQLVVLNVETTNTQVDMVLQIFSVAECNDHITQTAQCEKNIQGKWQVENHKKTYCRFSNCVSQKDSCRNFAVMKAPLMKLPSTGLTHKQVLLISDSTHNKCSFHNYLCKTCWQQHSPEERCLHHAHL